MRIEGRVEKIEKKIGLISGKVNQVEKLMRAIK